MGKVDMSRLFKGMQSEMSANLELGRAGIVHNGEMGEAAEESWRKWLRTLPSSSQLIARLCSTQFGITMGRVLMPLAILTDSLIFQWRFLQW